MMPNNFRAECNKHNAIQDKQRKQINNDSKQLQERTHTNCVRQSANVLHSEVRNIKNITVVDDSPGME